MESPASIRRARAQTEGVRAPRICDIRLIAERDFAWMEIVGARLAFEGHLVRAGAGRVDGNREARCPCLEEDLAVARHSYIRIVCGRDVRESDHVPWRRGQGWWRRRRRRVRARRRMRRRRRRKRRRPRARGCCRRACAVPVVIVVGVLEGRAVLPSTPDEVLVGVGQCSALPKKQWGA